MRFLQHYCFAANCPLSYQARLVYSFLAYRSELKQGASKAEIADELKMGRAQSVTPALEELVSNHVDTQLVMYDHKHEVWVAQEPPEGWCLKNVEGEYRFFRVYPPDKHSKVTNLQAVLLGMLRYLAFNRNRMRYQTLMNYLGLTREQIEHNFKRLVDMQLVKKIKIRGADFSVEFPQGDAPVYQSKKDQFKDAVTEFALMLRKHHGYPKECSNAVETLLREMTYYTDSIDKTLLIAARLLDEAREQHKPPLAGRKDSGVLLVWKLKAWKEDQDIAEQKRREELMSQKQKELLRQTNCEFGDALTCPLVPDAFQCRGQDISDKYLKTFLKMGGEPLVRRVLATFPVGGKFGPHNDFVTRLYDEIEKLSSSH